MIWGVYIEIYILWEFGYLIDSPLILYIYSTTDRKKTLYGIRCLDYCFHRQEWLCCMVWR